MSGNLISVYDCMFWYLILPIYFILLYCYCHSIADGLQWRDLELLLLISLKELDVVAEVLAANITDQCCRLLLGLMCRWKSLGPVRNYSDVSIGNPHEGTNGQGNIIAL